MHKRLLILTLISVLLLIVVFRKKLVDFFGPDKLTTNTKEVKLLIGQEPTFSELIELLSDQGIIKDPAGVRSIAIDEGLDTNSFAAGKFIVLSGERILNMLEGFTKDKQTGHGKAELLVNVEFNNSRDIYDLAGNLSKYLLPDSLAFASYFNNPQTAEQYGFTKASYPALFIPGSYNMYFDTSPEVFLDSMNAAYKKFWDKDRTGSLAAVGLRSPNEAATLASIVYSEQGRVAGEWPVIASLYLNRIRKGMRLQSDPTFKYCWGRELDNVQRLLKKHREINCPYNTYLIDGLPPGPICFVPHEVLNAVLHPAETDFLFMCAKPDYSGMHDFTSSDVEHERNARNYRRWLANELNK